MWINILSPYVEASSGFGEIKKVSLLSFSWEYFMMGFSVGSDNELMLCYGFWMPDVMGALGTMGGIEPLDWAAFKRPRIPPPDPEGRVALEGSLSKDLTDTTGLGRIIGCYLGPRSSGPFGGLLGVILTPPDCYPSSKFSAKLTLAAPPKLLWVGINYLTLRIDPPWVKVLWACS